MLLKPCNTFFVHNGLNCNGILTSIFIGSALSSLLKPFSTFKNSNFYSRQLNQSMVKLKVLLRGFGIKYWDTWFQFLSFIKRHYQQCYVNLMFLNKIYQETHKCFFICISTMYTKLAWIHCSLIKAKEVIVIGCPFLPSIHCYHQVVILCTILQLRCLHLGPPTLKQIQKLSLPRLQISPVVKGKNAKTFQML